MDEHIYSVKTKGQAGNIWIKYISNENTKAKAERKSAREFTYLVGNSAESLGSRRERFWGYISSYEKTTKTLLHLSPKSHSSFI